MFKIPDERVTRPNPSEAPAGTTSSFFQPPSMISTLEYGPSPGLATPKQYASAVFTAIRSWFRNLTVPLTSCAFIAPSRVLTSVLSHLTTRLHLECSRAFGLVPVHFSRGLRQAAREFNLYRLPMRGIFSPGGPPPCSPASSRFFGYFPFLIG